MTEPGTPETAASALASVQQRINQHPAFIEKQLCDGLARTIYAVLIPNRDELLGLLERAAGDVNLAVELFQNVRRPVVRTRFEGAVMRGLHNYVASVSSLVEHSRRIMRPRSGLLVEEFERRKAAATAHPELPFIIGLRNYVMHRNLPFVGHETCLEPQAGVIATSEIQLSVTELDDWDKWSGATRRFITSHGVAIPLRPIIERHAEVVIELNLWLYEQLADANAPAIAELNELVVEANSIISGTDLGRARRMTEAWTRLREGATPTQSLDINALLGGESQ